MGVAGLLAWASFSMLVGSEGRGLGWPVGGGQAGVGGALVRASVSRVHAAAQGQ